MIRNNLRYYLKKIVTINIDNVSIKITYADIDFSLNFLYFSIFIHDVPTNTIYNRPMSSATGK